MGISLQEATAIVDNALAKGRELNLNPLTVVVLDAGGHLVALKRAPMLWQNLMYTSTH